MIGNYLASINTRWMGVVEDTNDPDKLGRCKVRIFGIHSDNLQEVPTDHLPWASAEYPLNSSSQFAVPVEGTYVFGYFPDGSSAQAPIITGTVPGFMAQAWNYNKGFSPQSKNPIKTDSPFGNNFILGKPTIGAAARGDIANTNMFVTNNTLDHACDFRYFINFTGLNINLTAQLEPLQQIKDAINSGKNKAAMLMRTAMTVINAALRDVINALLKAITLDPSGSISIGYSLSKNILREINLITQQTVEKVTAFSTYYYLAKDIGLIVEYLKSLPTRIKTVVQGCITQFLDSINNFVNTLKTLPGVTGSDLDSILSQLNTSSNQTLNTLESSNAAISNTVTDVIAVTVYNPDPEHANTIMNYINENFANANVTFANATANSFSKSSIQSP